MYRTLPEIRQMDVFTALDDERQLQLLMALSTAEKRVLFSSLGGARREWRSIRQGVKIRYPAVAMSGC